MGAGGGTVLTTTSHWLLPIHVLQNLMSIRDGASRRWLCHAFIAVDELVGETCSKYGPVAVHLQIFFPANEQQLDHAFK